MSELRGTAGSESGRSIPEGRSVARAGDERPGGRVKEGKALLGASGFVHHPKLGFVVRATLALILAGLVPVTLLVAGLALALVVVVPPALALALSAPAAVLLAPLALVGRSWPGCPCLWPYWSWRLPVPWAYLRRSCFCRTWLWWTWLCSTVSRGGRFRPYTPEQ